MRAIVLAAGVGRRLGKGIPKCLVEIEGRSLLDRQIEALASFETTVVVGFQAERVIQEIGGRTHVVHNEDYATTSPCHSIALCSDFEEPCLILDGDLLFPPGELDGLIGVPPFIGVCPPRSEDPVYAEIRQGEVLGFHRSPRRWEWACVFCERPSLFRGIRSGYVYDVLAQKLPMEARNIDCFEIDTEGDLRGARTWVRLKRTQGSFGISGRNDPIFYGPT